MSKRYREPVEVAPPDPAEPPAAFTWRGTTYRVLAVLGHWREDAGFWSGGGVAVPQRDLWRVEAVRDPSSGRVAGQVRHGVYELVSHAGRWRLDRLWD